MMRTIKKFISLMLVTIVVVMMCFSITVRATVDSIWSGEFTILVNDVPFNPWGYSTDMAILYLCLFDMAYMLNGTSAQFDIRIPIDERWDFWIIRGESYTPTDTEFQPIPERFASRGTDGLIGWGQEYSGFEYYPEQTLLIGIDGADEPATTLAIRTIQDIDNTYFLVSDLAAILGFDSVITTDRWHPGNDHEDFVEGIDYKFTTETRNPLLLPVQSPEIADIMVRLSGQWVDREHFDNSTINESIVWPAELSISYHGINKPVTNSVAPIRPEWTVSLWEWERLWWYPVSMQTLENGLIELIVDQSKQAQPAWSATVEYSQEDFSHLPLRFQNYRIVVDPREKQIENITLYIGNTPHIMRRYDMWYTAARYTVEPADSGGIMFRYVFSRWDINRAEDINFRIYRSTAPIELGRSVRSTVFDELIVEIIHHQVGIALDDRIIFEFIDPIVEHGQVYYYSFWRIENDWHHNITPGNALYPFEVNIRVAVNDILGIPKTETAEPEIDICVVAPLDVSESKIPTSEELTYATDVESVENELSSSSRKNWIWITAISTTLVGLLVWFVFYRFFRKI